MSYLRYLCLFACSGVQHILCCIFCFVCLGLVCSVLPVSLIVYFCSPFRRSLTSTPPRPEACIVEHLILLLSVLITLCLYSEFARNSSFFYLKRVCSVNNTLFLTAVPDRLKCVISLVDYLLVCAVKSLFLCVLIFVWCAIFHISYSGI